MASEYDGLRSFLEKCEELGEIRTISGADWELEIGALTESTSELIPEPPALMFDEVKGYHYYYSTGTYLIELLVCIGPSEGPLFIELNSMLLTDPFRGHGRHRSPV